MLAITMKLQSEDAEDWIVIGKGEDQIRISVKKKVGYGRTAVILIDAPSNYPVFKDYASKKKLANLISKIELDQVVYTVYHSCMITKATSIRLTENEKAFLKAISDDASLVDGIRTAIKNMGYVEDPKELSKIIKKILTARAKDFSC